MRNSSFLAIFNIFLFKFVIGLDQKPSYDNSLAKICHKIELPSDLLFIIDGSGSVGGPTFDTQIKTLQKIVDMVDIGLHDTQIAVLQYSSYTYIEFGFSAYSTKDRLKTAISQLQLRSGTTKTGKALDRALQMFTSKTWGSRFGKGGVQQIAVVVSDGHSRDDPSPAAARLRQVGVRVIALGIGQHINMKELVDMTNNADYAFENLTMPSTMDKFTETFKQTTITDECEYLRGPEGAQISCLSDSISVGITMEKQFGGVLFVDGHFDDPKCKLQANSTDFELRVGLLDCGLSRQFLINPRGFAFASTIVLQFHPEFATSLDRRFQVHCFYQDRTEANELDWQLIKEHTQRKNRDDTKMPCQYSIEPAGKHSEDGCEKNFFIGDQVIHKWNCSAEHFDAYQSVFIRNCDYVDLRTGSTHKLIDENGCSLEPSLIETPEYTGSSWAHARGIMFKRPGSQLGKIRCQIQFCDRLMTDCEKVLPPKCHSVKKRQSGFAVGIRPLNWDASPPLVTFGKMEKQKMSTKRRRTDLDQSVGAIIFTTDGNQKQHSQSLDVKLSTQDVRVLDNSTTKDSLKSAQIKPKSIIDKLEVGSDSNKSVDDPFQNELKQAASGIEDPSELNENILNKLVADQIQIESPSLNIQNSPNLSCRFRT